MRIFVAAGYAARRLVRPRARQLRGDGHEVVSRWHDQPDPPPHADRDALLAAAAAADLADMRSADLVAVLTNWPSTAGGRHAELLGGLTAGKTVCVVGPLRHGDREEPLYAWLPDILRFGDWAAFRRWLADAKPPRAEARALIGLAQAWPGGAGATARDLAGDLPPNHFGARLAEAIGEALSARRDTCPAADRSALLASVRDRREETEEIRDWLVRGASELDTCTDPGMEDLREQGAFQRALAGLLDAALALQHASPRELANHYPGD